MQYSHFFEHLVCPKGYFTRIDLHQQSSFTYASVLAALCTISQDQCMLNIQIESMQKQTTTSLSKSSTSCTNPIENVLMMINENRNNKSRFCWMSGRCSLYSKIRPMFKIGPVDSAMPVSQRVSLAYLPLRITYMRMPADTRWWIRKSILLYPLK